MCDEVNEPVARFLRCDIDSVRELELLLALRTAAQPMTADAIAVAHRSGRQWTEQQLDALTGKGLASTSVDAAGTRCFVYAPQSAQLAGVVERAARLFKTHRTTVVQLIFAAPAH